MSWASATKNRVVKTRAVAHSAERPTFPTEKIDWANLVSLDFETFYDADFTLSKLSTSEYIRDPRFEALMVGIKIGHGKTKIVPGPKVAAALRAIPWSVYSLLCHNMQFDGFILSHHYKVFPKRTYCSLSMARGLHSNEIGAGLDEVSTYYGGHGKIEGGVEGMKGIGFKELFANKPLWARSAEYCANDVEEMLRVFKAMVPLMPKDEMDLIHLTNRMFIEPVLKVNLPRVATELAREIAERKELLADVVHEEDYDEAEVKLILKTRAERLLEGEERQQLFSKRVIGSSERFAELLRDIGVRPPTKISPAWMKKPVIERTEDDKYAYAFAKDDLDFINMPDQVEELAAVLSLDLNNQDDIVSLSMKQTVLRRLIGARLAVKSTTNLTRAQRFLTAGANGMCLPVGYAYFRAHTGRWGGNNKMNMQNLTRGGELRLSIEAPKGYVLCVADSGQIECRVNGWLWGQDDLMQAFRESDAGTGTDAYCRMASSIYGKPVTKDDKMERFVGKVCVAEGELVLTDRGLVPIQDISKLDRLWDGLEWVAHGGLIDQGVKGVITYDGLTATPDHEVFTEDGRIIPLWQAASEMARLQFTGAGGQNVRFCDDHVIADTPRKRLSVRIGKMQSFRGDEADVLEQPEERQDDFISQERAQASSERGSSGQEVRRDSCEMHTPNAQTLDELWRERDQEPVHFAHGVHIVGGREPAAPGLQGYRAGPDRQQRELRAREPATRDAGAERGEPSQLGIHYLAGAEDAPQLVPQPLRIELDIHADASRHDWRANTREVRVYDIANAGPRRRFTVSGVLVLNCVLALGFQMGAPKLQMTLAKGALGGPPVIFTLDHCKSIVNLYRRMNSAIENGWSICSGIIEDMASGVEGSHGPISWGDSTLYLPNGMTLKYPDLKKSVGDKGWEEWSYQGVLKGTPVRKKIYGGLLCLGAETEVLTDTGWKPLIEVRSTDKVWCGSKWVSHSGLTYRGRKATIDFGGVRVTPDHEVLVEGKWLEAQHTSHHEATSSFTRHHWTPRRGTSGLLPDWQRRQANALVGSVRLRQQADDERVGFSTRWLKKLRVPNEATAVCSSDISRHVQAPSLLGVAQHAGSLQAAYSSVLGALRRARDYGVQGVGELHRLLGRHARHLCQGVGPGSPGQLERVLCSELPMGDSAGQRTQYTSASPCRHTAGSYALVAGGGNIGYRQHHPLLPQGRGLASEGHVRPAQGNEQDVYDLVDAGPLRRFTVRGTDGQPFIVHNCENVVQALARIIVASQMLLVDKKYRIVMTTHDEAVAMPKRAQADACLNYMLKCFRTPPAWCSNLGLNAEGGHAVNYSK